MKGRWKTTVFELKRSQVTLEEGDTQQGRMFRLLKNRKGQWVTIYELGQAGQSRCVSAMMHRLRQEGCVIENHLEQSGNRGPGKAHPKKSWYRLLKEPREKAAELS